MTFACVRAVELRKANRYRLSAPSVILWAPEGGPAESGRGVIRDINASGVYIVTSAHPPVGARVQLEILLPQMANNQPGMQLHGEGTVIRVDSGSIDERTCGVGGFAASVIFYPNSSNAVLTQFETSGRAI